MFRNILFDWSGTLCDDLSLTLQATNYVISQYGLPALDRAAFRAEFQLPYPAYYSWKTPGVPIQELEDHYRRILNSPEAVPVTVLPHAREFLDYCKAVRIRCFILSSMDSAAFARQARELGLYDYFEGIHTGILDKESHIHTLLKQHGLRATDTAFIGDMQHDMKAAHEAGVCAIGVLTGYNNAAQLHEAEPDVVVPHLGMLQQLMQRNAGLFLPHGTLTLHSLSFECRLGVTEEERSTPQPVRADVTIELPVSFSETHDDISRSIDYDSLSRALIALAQAEPTCLLEVLAQKLADCCVSRGAASANVTLHKFVLPTTASVSATAWAGSTCLA